MTKLLELVMIVKNSGEILRECLQENKKWIDHWTILDTGSTDNTPDIIREELKDVEGNLYFSEFIDFSQARNKCLDLSSKICKYKIMLDDSYKLFGGKELRKLLSKSSEPCFLIKIGYFNDTILVNDYYSKRITKTSENIRYKYRIHEDVNCEKVTFIKNDNIFICDLTSMEHRIRTVNRLKSDYKLLKMDLEDNPNDPRTLYYLSKVANEMDKYKESLEYLHKLKDLEIPKGFDKNTWKEYYLFTSLYLIANIEFILDKNRRKYAEKLIELNKKIPNRIESLYRLGILYKENGNILEAEKIFEKLIYTPKPYNIFTILESDIYDYNIEYIYIEIKLILKKIKQAYVVLKELMKRYPNSQELINTKYNMCYQDDGKNSSDISSIELSDKKTIVIHIGCIVKFFNPDLDNNRDSRVSGSEYMAINLGKEFVKKGYRVIIFGSFDYENKSYEGVYNNIEFIDYKYFNEFLLKYVVDYLIISRETNYLVYYTNVKKVYLWVHDVVPIGNNSSNLQTHKDKFKGIVCVSEWQKNNIINKLDFPEDQFIVSRNAIYTERFLNKNIKKIPFRFIYSSSGNRGLNFLIKMIPKIKERYPETTLFVYASKNTIDYEILNEIKNMDYVFLNERLNQNDIAIEYLKSDIWLYPTDFTETYCITAVEAMISKCLVVTVELAALVNIVGNRGVTCKSPIEENMEILFNKLCYVLDNPKVKNFYIEKAYNWAINQTFDNLSQEWIDNIFTK